MCWAEQSARFKCVWQYKRRGTKARGAVQTRGTCAAPSSALRLAASALALAPGHSGLGVGGSGLVVPDFFFLRSASAWASGDIGSPWSLSHRSSRMVRASMGTSSRSRWYSTCLSVKTRVWAKLVL
eukprot:2797988-Rhodomonas_salina.2